METYETLLNEAYKKIKPVESKERFEIPQVKSMIEGIRTIIFNFSQICSHLRRNPEHLKKFLEKMLAAPSKIEGERLVMVKKIPSRKIDEEIKEYVGEFVLCKECKKPDTELLKQESFWFIHCLACGAKHSIPKL